MYDVIGDIHGHYSALHRLLLEMGYEYNKKNPNFSHPQGRKAVFVGDYIDRGLDNVKTCRLVRNMVETGNAHAIMGNHDYNAVMWRTPDPLKIGEFVRPHNKDNRKQHMTFLAEVENNEGLFTEIIEWMKSLPVYLKIGNAKFVHACWHQTSIDRLHDDGCLDAQGRLTHKGWSAGSDKRSKFYLPIERLLKGPEEDLPVGECYPDAQGIIRYRSRTAWWRDNPKTNADAYVSLPDGKFARRAFNNKARETLSIQIARELRQMPQGETIFIGHYWMVGTPKPLNDRVICVDYSVAKGDKLVAWRMDDANNPSRGHFASVTAIMDRKTVPVPK